MRMLLDRWTVRSHSQNLKKGKSDSKNEYNVP